MNSLSRFFSVTSAAPVPKFGKVIVDWDSIQNLSPGTEDSGDYSPGKVRIRERGWSGARAIASHMADQFEGEHQSGPQFVFPFLKRAGARPSAHRQLIEELEEKGLDIGVVFRKHESVREWFLRREDPAQAYKDPSSWDPRNKPWQFSVGLQFLPKGQRPDLKQEDDLTIHCENNDSNSRACHELN